VRVARIRRQRLLQGSDRQRRLTQLKMSDTERQSRRKIVRLDFQDRFQVRNRLAMPSRHMLRQTEIEQQSGIARDRANELFVDRDGLNKSPGSHQVFRTPRFERKVIRLSPGGDRDKKKKRQG